MLIKLTKIVKNKDTNDEYSYEPVIINTDHIFVIEREIDNTSKVIMDTFQDWMNHVAEPQLIILEMEQNGKRY